MIGNGFSSSPWQTATCVGIICCRTDDPRSVRSRGRCAWRGLLIGQIRVAQQQLVAADQSYLPRAARRAGQALRTDTGAATAGLAADLRPEHLDPQLGLSRAAVRAGGAKGRGQQLWLHAGKDSDLQRQPLNRHGTVLPAERLELLQ